MSVRKLQAETRLVHLCDFCGKTEDEVEHLVVGPKVDICGLCIVLAGDIIKAQPEQEAAQPAAPVAMDRKTLQPRLVHLIAGLRRHQVEEAVELLLNYIDASGAQAAAATAEKCSDRTKG